MDNLTMYKPVILFFFICLQENFEKLCSQVESQPQSSESGDNGSCTQPKPIDYDAIMIEAVGGINANGRVYGLGLDESMRANASTSKSKHDEDDLC